MHDTFALERFVEAQSAVYPRVVEELSAGRKRSHWMWFIFPQIAGLGSSAMAQRFAIGSKREAQAFLAHDLLGPRLIECTRLVMAASEKRIGDILGYPDDMKFRSPMTLFDASRIRKSWRTQSILSIWTAGTRRRSKSCPASPAKATPYDDG